MADLKRLEDDLGFVRASVDRVPLGMPPALYFLWGTLTLCGFALADVDPGWLPLYWTIAGPGGAILSAFLGWRHQRKAGHLDGALGRRHALHWGTLLCVILLGTFMVRAGRIAGDAFGAVVLLLLAQAYIHAGLHLDRPMSWIGLLLAAGYVVVLAVASYAWTITGAVIAFALLLIGIRESRGRVVA
jgi:hypothetical protein